MEINLESPAVEDLDTPYKRHLSLAVVLIALLGGALGYLASDAGAREDRTMRDAQRAAITAMSEHITVEAEAEENRVNLGAMTPLKQRHDLDAIRAELLERRAESAAATRWKRAYSQVQSTSALTSGKYVNRLDMLYSDLYVDANRATLRQQSAQETASEWGDKNNVYVAGVTLLAVALALLGLSLTVSVSTRRYLVWPAALLTVTCLVSSVVALVTPPETTSEEAVRAVAEGDRLASLRDFKGAVKAYDRAAAADGDYVTVYEHRSAARVLAASPERSTSNYVYSSAPRSAWVAAAADLTRALELGGERYVVLLRLGGVNIHLPDHKKAEEYSRRAIALNPAPPLPWLNLLAALAGQGRAADARRLAADLIKRIKARPDPAERAELYAAMRTTLDIVASQRDDIRDLAAELQGALVGAQGEELAPNTRQAPAATVSRLAVAVQGARITAGYTYRDLPKGAQVGMITYYRPSSTDEWSQRHDLVQIAASTLEKSSGEGIWSLVDGNCPPAGEYRVDLYTGTRRLASATAPVTTVNTALLKPHNDWIGGLALCRPDTWKFSADLAGSAELTSPDNRQQLSVRVTTVDPPSGKQARTELTERIRDGLIRRLPAGTTVTRRNTAQFGGVEGIGWQLTVSDQEQAYVWATLDDTGLLRTLLARFPTDESNELATLATYIQFG
ncbi:tetratricopeptide repeat protein [Streptosporangium sp. CA-115845]|uniref:tetratricopeptide repeat protein n=1 Tax=Streptosporangium sp. CA-115845 TaxID=3240071 RepID=UPI003D904934